VEIKVPKPDLLHPRVSDGVVYFQSATTTSMRGRPPRFIARKTPAPSPRAGYPSSRTSPNPPAWIAPGLRGINADLVALDRKDARSSGDADGEKVDSSPLGGRATVYVGSDDRASTPSRPRRGRSSGASRRAGASPPRRQRRRIDSDRIERRDSLRVRGCGPLARAPSRGSFRFGGGPSSVMLRCFVIIAVVKGKTECNRQFSVLLTSHSSPPAAARLFLPASRALRGAVWIYEGDSLYPLPACPDHLPEFPEDPLVRSVPRLPRRGRHTPAPLNSS